jgi:protein-S-isoprenylcysteine O-methyltransferase Ste14
VTSLLAQLAQLAPTVVLCAAVVVFPVLFFIDAPYGRYQRSGWGPAMPARWAWVLMESPSVWLFALLWLSNPQVGEPMVTGLGALWLMHYLQRTLVYPALMRGASKPTAVATVGLALVFNLLNASGNAAALHGRPFDAFFVVGCVLFVAGFGVNLHADAVLRGLRKPGETGYAIPQTGLYRYITSPNYLGEVLEWLGFALAAQTGAAWAFAIFTFANLAPRARAHQRWYREKFAAYPASRRKLVPFIW